LRQTPPTQVWPDMQQAPQPQSEVPEGQSGMQRPAEQVWPQVQPPGQDVEMHAPAVQV
jgi:hypothetical protein